MEWGNCHLDSMSDSEKAQLVGLVEGAPWQSYTNSILSFSCFFFFPPWVSPLPHCLHLELFQLVHCQQSIQKIIYLQYSWSCKQTQSDKSALLWRTNLANMTFVRTWKILKERFFSFMQNLIRCITRQSNIKQQWRAFGGQRTRDQGPLAVSCMAPNNNPTVLFLLPKINFGEDVLSPTPHV